MSFGHYFEEFEIGQEFRHWPGRTISEADNTWFSLLTMNQHPLHIDAHYAATTQHGRCLVVGTLVFSIAVGISVADISGRAIANLGYDEVKHLGPVFAGDTIYASSKIIGKRESATKPDLISSLPRLQESSWPSRSRISPTQPNAETCYHLLAKS